MRTTTALKTAAVLAAAVVLGLGTVQGSLAVWNATTASAAGTVRAADFDVVLTPAAGTPQRLSANGRPATVALPAITSLQPGQARTIPVTITNATDAGSGNFTIQVNTAAPTATGEAAGYLKATAGLTGSRSCAGSGVHPSARLAQGASATLCVTVELDAHAPATAGGRDGSIAVKLAATQL
ncbi:hypothetical protein [Arthrobacter sp.]|uniref:hypothetical protein n=1 Tax=Arthrobacter sp. TaxID=1667 RepID=UPI003A8FA9B0